MSNWDESWLIERVFECLPGASGHLAALSRSDIAFVLAPALREISLLRQELDRCNEGNHEPRQLYVQEVSGQRRAQSNQCKVITFPTDRHRYKSDSAERW
jgi:hypothetical protein